MFAFWVLVLRIGISLLMSESSVSCQEPVLMKMKNYAKLEGVCGDLEGLGLGMRLTVEGLAHIHCC